MYVDKLLFVRSITLGGFNNYSYLCNKKETITMYAP